MIIKMKYKATLTTESRNAKPISRAIDIDNVRLEDLKIETKFDDGKIITEIESRSMNSLLATLDDIIHCQIVAEKVIS